MIPIIGILVDRCNYSSCLMLLGEICYVLARPRLLTRGPLKKYKRTLLFDLGLPDFSSSFI